MPLTKITKTHRTFSSRLGRILKIPRLTPCLCDLREKNSKKNEKILFLFLLYLGYFLLWSCASTRSFSAIDNELERGYFAESVAALEKSKNSLYKNRDAILYYLDKGMLSHYASQYAESIQLLQDAERAIEEAFTRSVTREISTYLINDNLREYGGEDYEDIYINVFNALNYHHSGMPEQAMVEIRRMSNKLQHLSFKYDEAITDLQKMALEDDNMQIPPNPNSPAQFSDSALGRYIGLLFYRGAGLYDSARIDRDRLLAAFANSPAVYPHDIPQSISGELEIPRGMARLNVLAFGGHSPVKYENVIRIPLPNLRWIKIALPEMKSRHSEIDRIELVMENNQRFSLELLEDIDAVAKETFKVRQAFIYVKTIVRAISKTAGSTALGIAANEREGTSSLVLQLSSIAVQAFAEGSERADTRVSRYFPGKAYVTGINLPPGSYNFQIKYYNKNNREIASVLHQNIIIKENEVNIAQAVYLK